MSISVDGDTLSVGSVEGEWRVSGGLGAPYTHREPFVQGRFSLSECRV